MTVQAEAEAAASVAVERLEKVLGRDHLFLDEARRKMHTGANLFSRRTMDSAAAQACSREDVVSLLRLATDLLRLAQEEVLGASREQFDASRVLIATFFRFRRGPETTAWHRHRGAAAACLNEAAIHLLSAYVDVQFAPSDTTQTKGDEDADVKWMCSVGELLAEGVGEIDEAIRCLSLTDHHIAGQIQETQAIIDKNEAFRQKRALRLRRRDY